MKHTRGPEEERAMASSMAGGSPSLPEINVTPVIDVLRVLIIIFMIVAAEQKRKGLQAEIPEPQSARGTFVDRTIVTQVVAGAKNQVPDVKAIRNGRVARDLQDRVAGRKAAARSGYPVKGEIAKGAKVAESSLCGPDGRGIARPYIALPTFAVSTPAPGSPGLVTNIEGWMLIAECSMGGSGGNARGRLLCFDEPDREKSAGEFCAAGIDVGFAGGNDIRWSGDGGNPLSVR